MKTLITGGAGFVGKYLINELLKDNHEVNYTKLQFEKCNDLDGRCYNLDICNAQEVNTLIAELKPDVIFHLAGQSSVAVSWKNPDITVDANIKGSLNILEAVKQFSDDTKVILIGSSEEYGHIENEFVSENDKPNPANIYAVTKLCQGMIGKVYHDAYGLKTIMTRSFNHIGAGQSPMFAVSDFCRQAVRIEKGLNEPIIKTGNLSAMRDFTDVKDIVRAYIMLAKHGRFGEVYNVGSGNAVSLQSILDIIISMSDANIKIEKDPARFRPVDVPKIEANISKLQADTGWTPQIDIKQTVENVLDYWREYENA